MRRLLSIALVAVAVGGGPSGCLEWVVPGDHDDRGYDGRVDDLTQKPDGEVVAPLADRFDLIQAR